MYRVIFFIFFLFSALVMNYKFRETGIERGPAQEFSSEELETLKEIRRSGIVKILKDSYEEIRDLSLRLIEICPPEDCTIVSLGRSPSAIHSFLEAIYPETSLSVPISGFRSDVVDMPKLKDRVKQRLKNNFQKNLIQRVKTKKVYFVDYSVTGKSIYSVESFVDEFLNHNLEFDSISLVHQEKEDSIFREMNNEKLRGKRIGRGEVLSFSNSYYELALLSQVFDPVAEWKEFDALFGKETAKRNYNPRRKKFLTTLKKLMSTDKRLEKIISDRITFGHPPFVTTDYHISEQTCGNSLKSLFSF